MKFWLRILLIALAGVISGDWRKGGGGGAPPVGVTLGVYGSTDPSGWSTFVKTPITTGTCAGGDADGTCAVYINKVGNDGTCAIVNVGDTSKPCLTIHQAHLLERPSRQGKPDWILFRKGDTWTDESFSDDGASQCCWQLYGKSATELKVAGAYDPANPSVVNPSTGGNRPIFKIARDINGVGHQGGTPTSGGDFMAWVGLDIWSYQSDPQNTTDFLNVSIRSGFQSLNPFHFTLLEDMRFRNFGFCIIPSSNMTIRRSELFDCVGQGLDGTPPLTIEENLIDGNGWYVGTFPTGTVTSYTSSVTINQASPAVVTWSNNPLARGNTNFSLGNPVYNNAVVFASSGGGITAGNIDGAGGTTGTAYYAFDNNGTTFHLSTVPQSLQNCTLNGNTSVTTCNTALLAIGETVTGTNIPGGTTISAIPSPGPNGTITLNNSATGSGGTNLTFTPTPTNYVNTSAGVVSPQTAKYASAAENSFTHNLYNNGVINKGALPAPAPVTLRGNILSRGSCCTQLRAGGTVFQNAFIQEANAHNYGVPTAGLGAAATISDNLYIEGKSNQSGALNGIEMSPGFNGSTGNNLSPTTISRNIFANSITNAGFGIQISDNTNDASQIVTYSNNKIYNWGPTTPSNAVVTKANGVYAGTISNAGTSYTPATGTVTGATITTDPIFFGAQRLVITYTGSPPANNEFPYVWIQGIGGIGGVNNQISLGSLVESGGGTLTLFDYPGTRFSGSYTSGGTIYFPYTGQNFSGGSGTAAKANALVGPSNTVISVYLPGDEPAPGVSGTGYAVNNVLSMSLPGGSGFTYTVTQVANATDGGGNVLDAAGSNPGAFPGCFSGSVNNCLVSKYYDFVTSVGGHTTLDFILAARNNNKANWNPALTANKGLVPAIQAGFGL